MTTSVSTTTAVAWEVVAPLVVWDGDDTLWFVEPLYDAARSSVAEYVATLGMDPLEWEAVQRATDVRNVGTMGFSRDRFPQSCISALAELAGRRSLSLTKVEVKHVRQLATTVFDQPAPLADGAEEALGSLSEFARMALITKGDPSVQAERIAESKLARYFSAIFVVEEKGAATFRAMLDLFHADPAESWSIGNSLPSDINPALQLGMGAIWIDAHVWEHEAP